jgi:signal peptidase I
MRTACRLVWVSLCWAVLGAAAAAVVALVLPFAFNARSSTVMSGSMEPTIATGDVVVIQSIRPSQVRVGDVVTFRDPRHHGRLITHRVRGLRFVGAGARVTTKGDANTSVERWKIARDGWIGRVAYRIPKLGRLALGVQDPAVRLFLLVMPAVLLGAWLILGIWHPAREGSEESGRTRRPDSRDVAGQSAR